MFKKSKQELPSDKVVTVIGPDTCFNGTIKAQGLVRIDGVMEGLLETGGDVIIGENSRVVLEVKARDAAVAGHFKGRLDLSGKLEIRSTGMVEGDVKVKALVIDEGAFFSGGCEMKEPRSEKDFDSKAE